MAGEVFEQEVRSVARSLWNLAPGEGSAEFINNDEIDCVCRTEELIHLIECTTDRSMEKFRLQITKLVSAKQFFEKHGETVKMRAITLSEPTPQQRSFAKGNGVTALSFQEFKRGLLDSQQYLESRWRYRFGSATDPEGGSSHLPEEEYVEQPLTMIDSNTSYTVNEICNLLKQGKVVVLIGPFGAGKSLTIREVFKQLRGDFYRNRKAGSSAADPTPIVINLRDHWGQPRIDEVLRRHAHMVGFEKPEQIVRAWNAGQLLPLLDGFDELASPVMPTTKDAIRKSREEALKVIQAFMSDAEGKTGVLLAGRDHYFDSIEEARRLMRLPGGTIFVEVGEFSEEQAMEYLRKKKINHRLPTWLPRKPLLLGYCASRGLLDEVAGIEGDGGIALAWDQFLNRICEREADLSRDISGDAVRRLLEELATRARGLPRGSGPLLDSDLSDAYRKITGNEPLEPARTLLQRLPGLTAREQEIGARSFIDDEMMETLRAGPVARFIQNPYAGNPYSECGLHGPTHPLTDFGCYVSQHLTDQLGVQKAQYIVAAREAVNRWAEPTLALDSILTGASTWPEGVFDAEGLLVANGLADIINLEDHPIVNLSLQNCMLNHLRWEDHMSKVKFTRCQIVKLDGIANPRALPDMFDECDIETFEHKNTNSAIVRSELPPPTKVLLVILRKLFLQRGSGRAESALSRGLGDSLQTYVTPVRDLLVSKGIIYSHVASGRAVWHGNRAYRSQILRILERTDNSDDPLVRAAAELIVG